MATYKNTPSLQTPTDPAPSTAGGSTFVPLEGEGTFSFRCHKGIACFTKCCAKLRLLLMPYDILRMRSRLAISTTQFLDRYTDLWVDPAYRFPMVRLRMNEEDGACPFVTPEGCAIYEDRPVACRLYPVGRASTLSGRRGGRPAEKYFLVRETHCQGFSEDKRWELGQWLEGEGITTYDEMNAPWVGVVTAGKSMGPKEVLHRKHQIFYLASYDLDRFRDFVTAPAFRRRFELDPDLLERIRREDGALLRFSCAWLGFSLYGEGTTLFRTLKPS